MFSIPISDRGGGELQAAVREGVARVPGGATLGPQLSAGLCGCEGSACAQWWITARHLLLGSSRLAGCTASSRQQPGAAVVLRACRLTAPLADRPYQCRAASHVAHALRLTAAFLPPRLWRPCRRARSGWTRMSLGRRTARGSTLVRALRPHFAWGQPSLSACMISASWGLRLPPTVLFGRRCRSMGGSCRRSQQACRAERGHPA